MADTGVMDGRAGYLKKLIFHSVIVSGGKDMETFICFFHPQGKYGTICSGLGCRFGDRSQYKAVVSEIK